MARNKYPEETVNLILDVSLKLFMEKGYDHTTIQDIIDHLGGLSKGAIYHHFKSKEEIFDAVSNRVGHENERMLSVVRDDPSLSGAEKLKSIFRASLTSPYEEAILKLGFEAKKNPRFWVLLIQNIFDYISPLYIQPILEQGIEDGSIKTEYPREMADVMMLLSNLWMSPLMLLTDVEAMERKCRCFMEMMKHMGLEVMDDEMVDQYIRLCCSCKKAGETAK